MRIIGWEWAVVLTYCKETGKWAGGQLTKTKKIKSNLDTDPPDSPCSHPPATQGPSASRGLASGQVRAGMVEDAMAGG